MSDTPHEGLNAGTALIVGASGAIGCAVSVTLHAAGFRVALLGRNSERLAHAARQVNLSATPPLCTICDVTDRPRIARAIHPILQALGTLDVLVLAAGINVTDRSMRSLDPTDWDRVLAVNLTGSFNVVQAVLPHMREKGSGTIIQISSLAAIRPSAIAGAAYSVSKAGQGVLSACIGREERGRCIRATTLYVGETDTPLLQGRADRPGAPNEGRRQMILKPEDVAAAVRYIATQPPRLRIPEMVLIPSVDDYA